MANKTISDLNELTTVSNSDVLLVETNTETSKVTKENLLKEVKEQLNTKSNVGHTHDEYVTNGELDTKGLATETYVKNKIAEASLSGGEVDLSGLATKDELASKADISSIPTKTSQLTNDSGFIKSIAIETLKFDNKSKYFNISEIAGSINGGNVEKVINDDNSVSFTASATTDSSWFFTNNIKLPDFEWESNHTYLIAMQVV